MAKEMYSKKKEEATKALKAKQGTAANVQERILIAKRTDELKRRQVNEAWARGILLGLLGGIIIGFVLAIIFAL